VEQLKVRCPACQKLYQVDTEAIYSLTPHFECKACHAVFAFDFPPADLNDVAAFLVRNSEPGAKESPAVVLQAQPSLVQLWNQIFEDYEDEDRHDEFIKRCRELDALPFAKMKYQDLQGATGQDPLCEKYLRQIDALIDVKTELKTQRPIEPQKFMAWIESLNWKKIGYWAPLIVSVALVLVGFSNMALRNLIGVGMAIFVFQMLLTKVRL
jgi:hypothetical protein